MPYSNNALGEDVLENSDIPIQEDAQEKIARVGWPSFIFFLIYFVAIDYSVDFLTFGLSPILTVWINIVNFFVFSWLPGWNRRIGWWTWVFIFESIPFVCILPMRLMALFLFNLDKFGVAFDIGARVASYFKGLGSAIAVALKTASVATQSIEQAKEGDIGGAVQQIAAAPKKVAEGVAKKPAPSTIIRDLKESGKEMWETRKNAPPHRKANYPTSAPAPLPNTEKSEPKQNKVPGSSGHILDLSSPKKSSL